MTLSGRWMGLAIRPVHDGRRQGDETGRFAAAAILLPLMVLSASGHARAAERSLPAGVEQVYRAETSRIRGFDPVRVGDVTSIHAISKVYETLLQYAYLDRPYRVEPLLAEALPDVSPDGLEYLFRIRRGIFFQDDPCFAGGRGRELTADDFVYSIKRVADQKNASGGYWAFRGRIVGLDAFREASASVAPTDYDSPVEGLKATDRYCLRIRLTRPYSQLPFVLAMHYAAAVPREAVEYYGADFINHPVGTGPFILKSWRRNYRMEYVRNPKWRETGRQDAYPSSGEAADATFGLLADAGRPVPFIDRIVEYVISDGSTQWLMFLAGELDVSGVSPDNWDAVFTADGRLNEALAKRGVRVHAMPQLNTYYVGFNMDDPVVGGNRALRQALTCAFDAEQWVRFHRGRVVRAVGPIPPGVSGYDPAATGAFPFDLERARERLQEAGYPGGRDPSTGRRLELTLELGAADASTRETAELLGAFFDRIGVALRPSYNNRPAFFSKLEQRRAQMFLLNWVADYPDPQNFLQLFYSPNASPGPNRTNYRDPEYDRLYEAAETLPNGPERLELCRTMVRMVMEDCPWIFLHHPVSYGLSHRRISNYKPHDFPYGMIKYVRVDERPAPVPQGGLRGPDSGD